MDRYLHEVIQIHDVSPEHVVDYYWFPTNESRIAEICDDATACGFDDATIVTPLLPHEHELVHGVRSAFGFSQGFVEEGAAEIWGAHSDRSFDYTLDVEAGVDLAQEHLPIAYYGTAGRFSSFMLFEFGVDAFVELGRQATYGSSAVEVDEAFESVIGMTVSEAAQSYQDSGWRCARSVYRDDSISCAAARQMDCSLAEDDGTFSMDFDLDCGSEHFVGPRDGVIWSDFVIPLAQDRIAYLTLTADEDELGTVRFRPCDVGCEDTGNVFSIDPNREHVLFLSEGPHLLRIEVPADGQPRGKATLTVANVCEPRV